MRIRNPTPHPSYTRVAPPNQLPTLVPMRSLPNRLIADWKRPLLLAVVAAALIVSLGSDCQSYTEPFGYEYSHNTPPQWAPDGNHVVLTRHRDIMVVAVDGSGSSWHIHEIRDRANDRDVRDDASNAPNVSPDGTEVAYSHKYTRDQFAANLNHEIHVASMDGGNIRRLTTSDSDEVGPIWSPDGTRIAYWSSSPEGPAWALMTMARDGTDKRHIITEEGGLDPTPVRWSPDGRHLAFVQFQRTPTIEYATYVVGADGSNPTRLAPTSSSPLWARDSSRLFFVHSQGDADADDISTGLYSIRPDGTDLRTVANIGQYRVRLGGTLNWSPDGSEMWFYRGSRVTRITADGTDVSILRKRSSAGSIETAFSPNGSTLAVQVGGSRTGLAREEDKDVVLFLMDPDGSNPREVFRRALDGKLNWGGSLPTDNLIEWELTQYTPPEEQNEQTTATAG